MKSITLYEAFMLRKDLEKDFEESKQISLRNFKFLDNETKGDVDLTTKRFGENLGNCQNVINMLNTLNNLIDEANRVNFPILNKIESLKLGIKLFKELKINIENTPKFDWEYQGDSRVKVKVSTLYSIEEVSDILKKLEADKRTFERELAKANSRVMIDVPFIEEVPVDSKESKDTAVTEKIADPV